MNPERSKTRVATDAFVRPASPQRSRRVTGFPCKFWTEDFVARGSQLGTRSYL
jgi:hypothetical protein